MRSEYAGRPPDGPPPEITGKTVLPPFVGREQPIVSIVRRRRERAIPTQPEPASQGSSAPVEEETKAFVSGTLAAFAQEGLRIAAHAVGLGPVYELYYWGDKAIHAAEALVSDGPAELGLPIPVGGLDLMVRVPVGHDEPGEQSPLPTLFIAPGDGSLAAAIELAPAHDPHGHDHHHRVDEPAQQNLGQRETGLPKVIDVELFGPVAVAAMDLSVLEHRTCADRVAVLQNLAEQDLMLRLSEEGGSHDLALVFCYDRNMRLGFWTRLDPDPSRLWRMVAEVDPDTQELVIREVQPITVSEWEEAPRPGPEPRIVLRGSRVEASARG